MHTTATAVPCQSWARTGDRHTWTAAAGPLLLVTSRQPAGREWDWRVYRAGAAPGDRALAGGTAPARLSAQRAAEHAARGAR